MKKHFSKLVFIALLLVISCKSSHRNNENYGTLQEIPLSSTSRVIDFEKVKADYSDKKKACAKSQNVTHDRLDSINQKTKSILGMSGEEFAASPDDHDILFLRAKIFRCEMEALGVLIFEYNLQRTPGTLEGTQAELVAILKRDDKISFVKGIVEKVERKKYATIGRMGDIVRGRFNLRSNDEVAEVTDSKELEKFAEVAGLEISKFESPRGNITVKGRLGYAYPRFHVNFKDPKTDLFFEYQIGTAMVTRILETEGIKINNKVLDDTWTEHKSRRDLHDVGYDVFLTIISDSELKNLVDSTDLDGFYGKVDLLVAEAGISGEKMKEWRKRLNSLHAEAGKMLDSLISAPENPAGVDLILAKMH